MNLDHQWHSEQHPETTQLMGDVTRDLAWRVRATQKPINDCHIKLIPSGN